MRSRRVIFLVSAALPAVLGCLGEDVTSGGAVAPDASAGDAGATGGGDGGALEDASAAALPLLDDYSVSIAPIAGAQDACIATIDAAVRSLGGGYVVTNAPAGSFARYADRTGSTAFASCIEAAGMVVTEVRTARGSGSAVTDDRRLFALVTGGSTDGLVTSTAAGAVGRLDARQRILPGGALDASTCVGAAKRAVSAAVTAASAGGATWQREGPLLAIGGFAGTTFSVTCLNDTGVRVLDVVTVDRATSPDARMDALQAALERP